MILAWGILLAGAILLAVLWPWFPPTWVIHWGANGQPNGWAHKSFLGVYLPLLIGAFAVGTTHLMKPLTSQKSPWVSSPEADARFKKMNDRALDVISVGLALIMVAWSVILPLAPGLVWLGVVLTVLLIAAPVVLISQGYRQTLREVGAPKGFQGLSYNNPDDPRLWVPKLSGVGATLNFAHPWAWPVMIALLAFPLGIVLLVVLTQLR